MSMEEQTILVSPEANISLIPYTIYQCQTGRDLRWQCQFYISCWYQVYMLIPTSYQAKVTLRPNTSPIPATCWYEIVKSDPIPVPGWYESAQYQNPTGMWKGTYQYNTGYNGLLMRFHCKIFCDTLSLTVSLYHRWKQLLFTLIQLFTYCGVAFLFPFLFFFSFSWHRNLRLVRKDSMQPMYCLHNHLVLVDIKSHLAIGF
jgi:hypothetical protein